MHQVPFHCIGRNGFFLRNYALSSAKIACYFAAVSALYLIIGLDTTPIKDPRFQLLLKINSTE